MAIKYVCDVCGKEHVDSAMGLTTAGFYTPMYETPPGWAAISVMAPQRSLWPPKGFTPQQIAGPVLPTRLWNVIVCSQACAEKALDEAKEHLRKAFEKVEEP